MRKDPVATLRQTHSMGIISQWVAMKAVSECRFTKAVLMPAAQSSLRLIERYENQSGAPTDTHEPAKCVYLITQSLLSSHKTALRSGVSFSLIADYLQQESH